MLAATERAATACDPIAPLTSLPGVGPARERALAALGVSDVRDLLFLTPRRIATSSAIVAISRAREMMGQEVTVAGRVQRLTLNRFGRRSTVRLALADETGSINALFFNQPWMRKHVAVGDAIELAGRVVDSRGPALVSPKLGSAAKPLAPPGTLVPLYPTGDGAGQEFMRKLCRAAARAHAARIADPLPPDVLATWKLVPLARAIADAHDPRSSDDFEAARRRLALEPLLRLQARVCERRAARGSSAALAVRIDDRAHDELLARFPFELTAGQCDVAGELRRDLARTMPMRRLLQGDVGSGKTALGVYACLATASAGGQSAFLAPTELLAEQHYDGLRRLLARAGLHGVLLTGSMSSAERKHVIAQLESGMADVAFGTHALFGGDVRYKRLALCVVDEQQRFGVAQRARFFEKGADVHVLLMTATPIPRTLASTIYGDLDVSVLAEKPPGRGLVRTRWVRGQDRKRVQPFLLERAEQGEQIYWVVPRIGAAGDDVEEAVESGRASAEVALERLMRTPLAAHGIELVHGRIPAAERAERLERFRRGDARVLVATSVIEVGVDVPGATVMVIENAERLGLAQLHQLRGRIGRSRQDGWCLLFGDRSAEERFLVLERTNDGFEIAEEDLRRRGMGDLAGLRQAGENAEGLDDIDLALVIAARDLALSRPDVLAAYHTDSSRATP
jgi:ATP-dependent DNA helicase RecG